VALIVEIGHRKEIYRKSGPRITRSGLLTFLKEKLDKP
jgi:hypothetical protein